MSVIVPTYCEALNLPVLVPRISKALEEANISGEIIIVDDDSPDDTESICNDLAAEHPVRVMIRKDERGLSSSVIDGMNSAKGDVLLVMDADLSHPPEKIPELVRAFSKDTKVDFVIGSRYVPGGGTDENWGLFRWLNSKLATILAYPLTKACDPLAGFFALRRDDFRSADHLNPVGYKIGLELMVKCGCQHIHEVPIFFSNRLHGESKLSLKEQFNYLRHLKLLYEYKNIWHLQPLLFAMVGSTGMIVDMAVFSVLMLTALSPYVARALAIWCAMTWNFFWNRRITFSKARQRHVLHQYGLYLLSCLLGAVINWSVFSGLHYSFEFFTTWWGKLIAAFIGIVCGFVFDYLMSKHVAFK